MKTIFSLSLVLLIRSPLLWACSETGPMEFEVSPAETKECGKIATKYATQFAKTIVRIEGANRSFRVPKGELFPAKGSPSLYVAKHRVGKPNLIGFNVGIDSKDKWECNYCVEMSLEEGSCKVESVRKDKCAH